MAYFRAGTARARHEAQQITVAKTPLATFESNVSGLYIPEILAYIEATQSGSGDPSPSNPRAINGVSSVDTTRTGVNLWSYGNVSGTRYASISVNIRAGTYNISAVVTSSDTDASNNIIGFRYADGTYIYERIGRNTRDNTSVILEQDVNQIRFYASDSNAHSVDDTFTFSDIQLQTGNTATPYEPYTGQTATTNLGGTYYGGYVNVTTGLMTVTHGFIVYDGSADENWSIASDGTQRIPAPADMQRPDSTQSISNSATITNDITVGFGSFRIGTVNLIINVGTFADETAIKAYLANNNFEMLYPLATPIEIQLTPAQIEQLLGQNNVFCSSGDVAVKGWKID